LYESLNPKLEYYGILSFSLHESANTRDKNDGNEEYKKTQNNRTTFLSLSLSIITHENPCLKEAHLRVQHHSIQSYASFP
jgi:hypothetical protein